MVCTEVFMVMHARTNARFSPQVISQWERNVPSRLATFRFSGSKIVNAMTTSKSLLQWDVAPAQSNSSSLSHVHVPLHNSTHHFSLFSCTSIAQA